MLIDGKKYACATCIAGHRTSKCQHRDGRELKEVKARGRPTTQCDICRERRRQGGSAHGRCSC
ncbi:copper-fist-domain-containing protein, partial [Tilletiaria anomala UBC 951]